VNDLDVIVANDVDNDIVEWLFTRVRPPLPILQMSATQPIQTVMGGCDHCHNGLPLWFIHRHAKVTNFTCNLWHLCNVQEGSLRLGV